MKNQKSFLLIALLAIIMAGCSGKNQKPSINILIWKAKSLGR
jgi:PBP1b-binding outer membrane lipoprotein LpoB